MRKQRNLFALVLSLGCALPSLARATGGEAHPAPLTTLPKDKLLKLAPLLRTNDLALIESNEKGELKQLTTISYAAASPEEVRDVVAHPERYKDFVRNTKRDDVKVEPGGTLFHSYVVNYTIYEVDGRHRYTFPPKGPDDAVAPVEMYDPDSNGVRHFRFEFLPVPTGGTMVVLYGYSKVPRDGFLTKFLDRAPTLEYGLAMIPQMTLLLSMKNRAAELSKTKPPAPAGTPGSYDFMLDRGTLALFRTEGGRLRDLSMVDRTNARPEVLLNVLGGQSQWSQFVPTFARSTPLGNQNGMAGVETEQSLPLITWTTTWASRAESAAVDMFAVSGDLYGSRLRWDVRARTAQKAELVLRAIQDFSKGSMVVRQLYKLEPLFEYGIDVGMNLLLVRAVREKAEQLTANRATR
jgi:hypothetical protein